MKIGDKVYINGKRKYIWEEHTLMGITEDGKPILRNFDGYDFIHRGTAEIFLAKDQQPVTLVDVEVGDVDA